MVEERPELYLLKKQFNQLSKKDQSSLLNSLVEEWKVVLILDDGLGENGANSS